MFRNVNPSYLLTVTLVLATGCHEQESVSPKASTSPAPRLTMNVAPLPPTIRFSKVSVRQLSSGYTHLEFEVHNPNAFPLPYSGYLRDAFEPPLPDGTIFPMYTVEFRRAGKWQQNPIGWCGMGIGTVELPPQETVVFDFPAPDDDWESLRIAIKWGKDEGGQTWSEPVSRTQIKP